MRRQTILLLAAAAFVSVPAFATLLPNGDFETPGGSGWTWSISYTTPGYSFNQIGPSTNPLPYAGLNDAGFGQTHDGSNGENGYNGYVTLTRSSSFAIGVGDQFDFWYNLNSIPLSGPGSTDTFTAKLKGFGAGEITLLNLGLASVNATWDHFTMASPLTSSDMNTLFGNSTGGFGNIAFTVNGDGAGSAGQPYMWVYIDNVSHDTPPPDNTTPELGTFALLGMSMLPMAGVAIRRRRKSA